MTRLRKVTLPALGAAATLVLAGCSSFSQATDVLYCVDKDNSVVDQKRCDDDASSGGGGFFYMVGPYRTGLAPGTRIDPGQAASRFASNDAAARSSAGVSRSGPVTSGESISGKSGGIGSGSGKSGGFGGGGSGG